MVFVRATWLNCSSSVAMAFLGQAAFARLARELLVGRLQILGPLAHLVFELVAGPAQLVELAPDEPGRGPQDEHPDRRQRGQDQGRSPPSRSRAAGRLGLA